MSLSSIANNRPRYLNTSTLSSDCPYAVNDTTIASAESTAACCYIFLSIASLQYWDVVCEVLSTRWVYCNPQRSHFGSGCNPSIVTQSQGWRAWKCHQRVQLVSCSYTARHWAGVCDAYVSVWCISPRLVFYVKVLVNNPRLEHPMLSLKMVGQRAHRQLFVAKRHSKQTYAKSSTTTTPLWLFLLFNVAKIPFDVLCTKERKKLPC